MSPESYIVLATSLNESLKSCLPYLPYVALAITLFTLLAKWQEKPRLRVYLPQGPARYSEGNREELGHWRFAHLYVQNPGAPWWASWLAYRQAAQDVRVELKYYDAGGTQPKFEYDARWSRTLEPHQERLVDGRIQKVFDPSLVLQGRFMHIAGGVSEPIAIAIKFEGEEDSYGFTNESYYALRLSKGKYRLPKGIYRVKATAVSGQVRSKPAEFLLHNDGSSLSDLWLDIQRRSFLHG